MIGLASLWGAMLSAIVGEHFTFSSSTFPSIRIGAVQSEGPGLRPPPFSPCSHVPAIRTWTPFTYFS